MRRIVAQVRRLWPLAEVMPARLMWAGGAVALQAIEDATRSWSQLFLGQTVSAGVSFVLMTLSLIGLGIAVSPRHPAWLAQRISTTLSRLARRAVLLTCLALALAGVGLLIYIGVACFHPQVYYNDGALLDQHAATILLRGENPYSLSDGVVAERAVHQPAQYLTPLQQGKLAHHPTYPSAAELTSLLAQEPVGRNTHAPEFETHVSYPALSFLPLVPLVWAGSPTTLPFYLGCVVTFGAVGVCAARREWRRWVALLLLADVPVINSALGGDIALLCVLFLLLAWLFGRRWWVSAAWMGLALATKQTAWLYLPFYLIFVWRFWGGWDAVRRLGLAGALFLAINLPFIMSDGGAWLAGVLAPLRDPMYPLGAGLVALANTHLLPLLSRGAYAALEGLTLVAALALYWRWSRARPEVAMLLATLPLFVAWRSLPSYFEICAPLTIILLAARAWSADLGDGTAHAPANAGCDARRLTAA